MNNIFKIEFYDKFRCIADQCSFTCCEGWDISVDLDIYEKWKSNDELKILLKNLKLKKTGKETEYFIKMGLQKCCPFLDGKKLCNIVIKNGEDYMPRTCRIFPRVENCHGDLQELSLSCTCPAVVDIINQLNEKIKFVYHGDKNIWVQLPPEYKIRETMIKIMQNSKFSFKERILLVFQLLLSMKKELIITKEAISNYKDEDYLMSLSKLWHGIQIENEVSLLESNELFLDIVQNYRNERKFRQYLEDIAGFADAIDLKRSQNQWEKFKIEFDQYEQLIENCMISKIFSNCICVDIDDMIMQYQIIITEYAMVRFSAFLLWLSKKEFGFSDIRNYIVTYSRIIEYNSDGIREFWEDSFDEAAWDLGYMLMLID